MDTFLSISKVPFFHTRCMDTCTFSSEGCNRHTSMQRRTFMLAGIQAKICPCMLTGIQADMHEKKSCFQAFVHICRFVRKNLHTVPVHDLKHDLPVHNSEIQFGQRKLDWSKQRIFAVFDDLQVEADKYFARVCTRTHMRMHPSRHTEQTRRWGDVEETRACDPGDTLGLHNHQSRHRQYGERQRKADGRIGSTKVERETERQK